MNKATFYRCATCGNIVVKLVEARPPIVCCGKPMEELTANTADAATEKHVPAVTVEGNTVTVQVGSVEHPMTEEHYITWVYLVTEQGVQIHEFKPGDTPKATFVLSEGDKALEAYEYCTLHGLWKAEI